MAEKVTVMVLKVDLQCPCCYKKVKKILCKFPQIRDQVYDEKANTVTITVFCCDPEKIRDKLCCKGAKVIKSIEIKEPAPKLPEKPKAPEKPKEPEKPKVPVPAQEKPKEPEKPKAPAEKPKEPEKPKVMAVDVPKEPKKPPKEKPAPVALPPPEKPKVSEPPKPPAAPVPAYPPAFPVRTCCGECYHGYGGGPCYMGFGVPPPPPPPCYDGWYYDHRAGYYVSRCDYYLSEENPHSCSIM